MDYPQERLEIIYVDTDSTDGSPNVARSLGVTVYEEHSDFPSPGRARNRGWREAQYEIIHFVDGDMSVDPGYLREAVGHLGQGNVACVIGRLQERHASRQLLPRILEYSWKAKQPGFVDAPGAGGTFLKSALAEIGGYEPYLLRGEETALGHRLRCRGYRILLLDRVMGTHDYDIHTPRQLWAHYYSIGRSFAKVLQLPPSPSFASERRAARRHIVQGGLALLLLVALLALRLWWMVLLTPLLMGLYVVVRYWSPARLRGVRIAYFILGYFYKPAIWFGMVQYTIKPRS
jgi:cellulose synthase/poly-beta-1,6-N-acetylglucosamine synthase-like glycosyltransferase